MLSRSHILRAAIIAGCFVLSHHSFGQSVGDVFVIDMENNDWNTPQGESSYTAIDGDSTDAPFINSLISTSSTVNPAYKQVSYANQYHNDYDTNSTTSQTDPNIHPSCPNYVWQEAGSNFSVNNDNDPYGSGGNVATISNYLAGNNTNLNGTTPDGQNLSGLLQNAGISWKSYQEDTGLLNTSGLAFNEYTSGTNPATPGTTGTAVLTNNVASSSQQTVPLSSFSGSSASYTNAYNGTHSYNFACKHDGQLYFADTNGGDVTGTNNTEASHYEALQSLSSDLTNNTVGRYNLITPDQYNDMHTGLGSWTDPETGHHYSSTSDAEQIAQGDNFLSIVVPEIMASQAYQNNGAIVLWTDETEGTHNDSTDTLMEIVISKLSKGSTTGGGVYSDTLNFDHSSDVATFQEIYGVAANTPSGYLNNASTGLQAGSQDLSDLFVPGTITQAVPEPGSIAAILMGAASLLVWGSKRRRSFSR